VGVNGECSGLVRDYISLGLKVLTDENSPELITVDNVMIVKKEIQIKQLSDKIIVLLSEKHVKNKGDFVDSSRKNYEKLLKKMLVI